jgi:hypothetical protein
VAVVHKPSHQGGGLFGFRKLVDQRRSTVSFQLQKRKKNSRFSKSTIDGKLLS